jgi:hypothetical protein
MRITQKIAMTVGQSGQVIEGPRDALPTSCPTCEYIKKHDGFGPRHNGSSECESGSIASGGENAHCTCDTCF